MPIIRKIKFGKLLSEENQKTKGQRLMINQNVLDDAKAKMIANPSLQNQKGGKFVKSLTQKDYNIKKDRKKDGSKTGAYNVGETEGTTIDFGAGKTTVSRFSKLPNESSSKKAFGALVGDIKRRVNTMANSSKSVAPTVKPVKPTAPRAKNTKYNAEPPKVKVPKALK